MIIQSIKPNRLQALLRLRQHLCVAIVLTTVSVVPALSDELVLPQVVPPAYAPPPSGPILLSQETQSVPPTNDGGRIFSSGPIEPTAAPDETGVLLPPASEDTTSPAVEKPPTGTSAATPSTTDSSEASTESSDVPAPAPSPEAPVMLPPASDAESVQPAPVPPAPNSLQPVDDRPKGSRPVESRNATASVLPGARYAYTPAWETQNHTGDPTYRWFSVESLIWWTNGSHLPAIATTSPAGTPPELAGVLAPVGSGQTLYGNGDIFEFNQSGFRLRGGQWFDDRCDGSGVMAEFYMLAPRSQRWAATSDGDPILTRPFFNADPAVNRQDSQIIALPGLSSGSLRMSGNTNLYSAAVHLWAELEMYVDDDDGCGSCGQRQIFGRRGCRDDAWLLGLKIGPRFSHLNDTIAINELLISDRTGSQFQLRDHFDTQNSFLGGEIGLLARRQRGKFNLDLGLQLAIGGTHQELEIRGRKTVTTAIGATTEASGFYAQPSNIGKYDETSFSLIPALDVNAGVELGDGWRFTVGYSLTYWTNVLRASEQIDTTINESFFNSPTPGSATPNRPRALFSESDYLAHGLTIGFERRW